MKKKLYLIPIFVIILLSIGCQTSKTAIDVKAAESQMLYKRAIKALESQKFIIEANELYSKRKKDPVITTPGSYISVNDREAIIHFTPEVFPGRALTYLTIKDNASIMKFLKEAKNGDR